MEEIIQKLNKDGFVVTKVFGSSMYPMLKSNFDKIVLEKPNSLNKLDTVLYKNKDFYVLHRVIKIDGNKLTLRGDNRVEKEVIDIKDVKAILKGYYHTNEYVSISDSINSKYYYLSLITYPFRLLIKKIRNII